MNNFAITNSAESVTNLCTVTPSEEESALALARGVAALRLSQVFCFQSKIPLKTCHMSAEWKPRLFGI